MSKTLASDSKKYKWGAKKLRSVEAFEAFALTISLVLPLSQAPSH